MKKILSFLILGVSVLQFLACSSDSGNGPTPDNTTVENSDSSINSSSTMTYLYGEIEEVGELLIKPLFLSLGINIEWDYTKSSSLDQLYSTKFVIEGSSSDFYHNLAQQLSLSGWQDVSSYPVEAIIAYKNNIYKFSMMQLVGYMGRYLVEISKIQ